MIDRRLAPRRRPAALALVAGLVAALASCSSTRPVDEVLVEAPPAAVESAGADASETVEALPLAVEADPLAAPDVLPDRETLARVAELRLAESAATCRVLLERARAEGADYGALIAASRALAFDADLRIQTTLALSFDPADLPSPESLITAEDDVPGALKSEVRSLATSSRDFADRALELKPGDAAGELFSTLGTGLRLWSMPVLQALANGAVTTLPGRISTLSEDHPTFEGASPLRLKGRFQSRAPWPFGDREGGRDTLGVAAREAPIPLNLLFYGDALWLNGERDAAREAWRRATRARADEETEAAAPFIREIARLRIESARARG